MITQTYFPEYSGAATQCHTLSKKLNKKGYKIFIITFTNDIRLPSLEWIDDIRVIRIHVRKKRFTGLVTALKLLFYLIKETRYFKIIHFHGFNNHLLWVVWLGAIFRKKVIMKISLMQFDNPEFMMNRGFFHRIAYQHLDKIIATTSTMMKEFQEYPSLITKGVLIPNGVDTDMFHPVDENEKIKLRRRLGLPISKKIVLFSGVIGKRKGVNNLLSAWEMLKQKLSDSCPSLLVLGPFAADIRESTPEHEQIKKKILSTVNKHPNDIFYLGMKQNIENYYKCSDIFVLPTKNEGLPNALLEAMSCALNCVVGNFPGVGEISRSLKIIDSTDRKDLYNALLAAVSIKQPSYSSRQEIIKRYSIEKTSSKIIENYK